MDNLDFALQVMVLGFLVVMVTLFALFGILILFNRIFYKPAVEVKEEPQARTSPLDDGESGSDDRRVVAAIMAAVYRCLESDRSFSSGSQVRISVQPSGVTGSGGPGLNSWLLTGRKELMTGYFELENIRRKKHRENI